MVVSTHDTLDRSLMVELFIISRVSKHCRNKLFLDDLESVSLMMSPQGISLNLFYKDVSLWSSFYS